MRTRRKLIGATVAALIAATTALTGPTGSATAAGRTHTVRPVPASAGHIHLPNLDFPPTTADCQALAGINCYDPPQFQEAYNLKPLWRDGFTGRGRTIVIVDAFGSPTI